MNKLDRILRLKKGKEEGMDDLEKTAKMDILEQLRKAASEEMGDKLKNYRKVTVASDDAEGLEAGLEKAKEMLSHSGEEEQDEDGEDEMHESEEDELLKHLHGEDSDEEESEEDLDRQIQELLQKKAMLSK